jgi:hypothetical protein
MKTACPHCQKQLEISDDVLGKQIVCPACQQEFSVTRLQEVPGSAPSVGVPAAWQPSPYVPSRQPALNLTPPKWLLLIGLVLVIFSRGCDSIRSRGVARSSAKVAKAHYDDASGKKVEDLREDARNAGINNVMWGYWTEWIFVLGSILLMIGLILVGFTGAGAERIICLVMIAIITFSIYIGGIAWIPSVLNSVVGGVQSIAQMMDRMF